MNTSDDNTAAPNRVASVPGPALKALAWIGPMLMVLWLCSLIFLSRYRITRQSHLETLAELERRRQ